MVSVRLGSAVSKRQMRALVRNTTIYIVGNLPLFFCAFSCSRFLFCFSGSPLREKLVSSGHD
jgi:hypothetical protein